MSSLRILGWPLLFVASCGGAPDGPALQSGRAVSVLELAIQSPSLTQSVPGVAQPYRQGELAFEVSGRMEFILDSATEVVGKLLNENGANVTDSEGRLVQPGDVVARLEDSRYRDAVAELELRLKAAELNLKAQQIQIDGVLQADRESARAQLGAKALEITSAKQNVAAALTTFNLKKLTAERDRNLVASKSIPQANLDQSEADLETAITKLDQARTSVLAQQEAHRAAQSSLSKAEGGILSAVANLEVSRADLATLRQQLKQSQTDLDACVLRAPFDGRLTAVHVTQGSFVPAGSPIAVLTLLNPILISTSISAEENRRILRGSQASLYPASAGQELSEEQALLGTVWEKDDVADPTTRTFKVGVITRNQQRIAYEHPNSDLAVADSFFPVVYGDPSKSGPLYVHTGALLEKDGKTYVLRVKGSNVNTKFAGRASAIHEAEQVEVELGEGSLRLLNRNFRELVAKQTLSSGDLLVINPREEHLLGFVLDNRQWVFHPGDLVHVVFDQGNLPAGIYVPVPAISELNGSTTVSVVDAEGQVRKLPVQVFESWRDLRRIEGAGIEPGSRIIVKGAHFVSEGETVNVVETSRQ